MISLTIPCTVAVEVAVKGDGLSAHGTNVIRVQMESMNGRFYKVTLPGKVIPSLRVDAHHDVLGEVVLAVMEAYPGWLPTSVRTLDSDFYKGTEPIKQKSGKKK